MSEKIYVIFDGPPSYHSGRFIEVEDEHGISLAIPQNGYEWKECAKWNAGHRLDGNVKPWRLGPFYAEDTQEDLKEAEAKIERLIKAGEALLDSFDPEGMASLDAPELKAWEEAKR